VAVETPAYEVLLDDGTFELRRYRGYLTANVRIKAQTYNQAANAGFGYLADYIFGNNAAAGKIAMTAPVGAERVASEKIAMTAPVGASHTRDEFVITFTMPSQYTAATLPVPNSERVYIEQIAPYVAATVRFSGYLDDAKQAEFEHALRGWMAAHGLTANGEPVAAQYDAPWRPWFARRNEIVIPVADPREEPTGV
jgi:hypothetical protein